MRTVLCIGLCAALALAAGGCTPRPKVVQARETPGAGPAHAAPAHALQSIMKRLDRLARNPQGTDTAGRAALAEAAADLAGTADALPEDARTLADADAQARFRALANRLYDQASRFKSQAPAATLPELQATMRDIDATCDACHRQFRNPPQHILQD